MASIKARLAAAAKAGGGAAPGVPDTDAVFAEYGATPHGGRTAETASEQKVPMPSTLKEQSYVPLAVAQATIKRMTEDMQGMQSRHAELVGKVQAYYTDREEKSRQHYVEYIESMRDRANTRIQYYRSAATTLKQQLQEAEAGAARDKTAAAATAASAASQLDALKATVAAGDSENGQAKVALVEQHAREVEELRAELAAARAAPVPAHTVAPAAALAASSASQPAADSGEAVAALHAAYAAFPSLKAQLAREANEKLDAREATIAALREQVAALQGQLARTGQGAIALAAAAEGAAASGGGDPQAAVRLAAAQEEVTRLQREVEALHAAPAQPLAQSDAEFLGKVVAWSSDPVRAARLTAATAPPDAAGVDPAAREAALAPFKAEVRSAAQEVQVTAENKAELSGAHV